MANVEKVVDYVSGVLSNLIPKPADAVLKPLIKPVGDNLKAWLADKETQKALLKAAEGAEGDFREQSKEKFGNDKLTQAVASFPLHNGDLFQAALQDLPSHFNETYVANHISNDLSKYWSGEFSWDQIQEATALYVDCLRVRLLHVDGFANIVTRLAVLRIDRWTEKADTSLDEIKMSLAEILELLLGLLPNGRNLSHDTIGFIPPAKAVTYIQRGKIEEEVIAYIREGGKGAIIGVHAPGGLGKTELAKHTAEQMKDEFEILWVDVGEKMPQQVAGELLIKCGVQTQPTDSYEHLVNELRNAYQNHHFLVILDDVRKESLNNLNELLPPSPCAALVTSRVQQIGGVKTFPLDTMSWDQTQELFQAILGDDVVSAELDTLKTLAERCKFNPLAMEIAARRIRQFEGMKKPVMRYFEIARSKFSELKIDGDERWDMERIFDISYQDLSADDQEKFLSLSSFHPTGFSLMLFLPYGIPSRRLLDKFFPAL